MMTISTTAGGLENIALVRLAFHQVATTHTVKKKKKMLTKRILSVS